MLINISDLNNKCYDICEMDREGENLCCYFCTEKDSCENPCNQKPYNCNNSY